jgi:hypothetical protein
VNQKYLPSNSAFKLQAMSESVASCAGLREALRDAPTSQEETTDELDGEIEANSPESWSLIDDSEGTNSVLDDVSTGVAETTAKGYQRSVISFCLPVSS